MGKGKLMNPTDKARKEARRKELKKNKKQRQQVRSTIIEEKDPEQIIADLEKLDQLEFDLATSSNENIIKDKRKKLKDIWNRIMLHYSKEDTEKHASLKKLFAKYESNHKHIAEEFKAIKAAEQVKLDEIFLPPQETDTITAAIDTDDDDPLLSEDIYLTALSEGVKLPGCPPGPPPDLTSFVKEIMTKTNVQNNLVHNNLEMPNTITSYAPTVTVVPAPWLKKPRRTDNLNREYTSNKQEPAVSRKTNEGSTPKKEAVIESKPVIFKPKSTQFIPVAVQMKMKKSSKLVD